MSHDPNAADGKREAILLHEAIANIVEMHLTKADSLHWAYEHAVDSSTREKIIIEFLALQAVARVIIDSLLTNKE